MSSGQGASPPMHFCHECSIEIRPLMTPHPTCPRCNGGFVEEIDRSQAAEQDNDEDMAVSGWQPGMDAQAQGPGMDLGQFMASIVRNLAGVGQDAASERTGSRSRPASVSDDDGEGNQGGGNSQAGNSRGTQMGGSNRSTQTGGYRSGSTQIGPVSVSWGVGSSSMRSGPITEGTTSHRQQPYVHDDGMGGAGGAADGRFFNHDNNRFEEEDVDDTISNERPNNDNARRAGRGEPDIPPELASLRAVFSNLFGGIEDGPAGILMDMFGGGGGRSGDYVWGQQGLDDVITQLMDASRGTTAPPPASEEALAKLQRFTRKDVDRVRAARNEECSTCMDSFLEDEQRGPVDASKDSNLPVAADVQAGMVEVDDPPETVPFDEQQNELVMMPCRHLFHQDCLIPWLKTSGTCPVCRVSLEPQREQQTGQSASSQSTATDPLGAAHASSFVQRQPNATANVLGEREDTDIEYSEDDEPGTTFTAAIGRSRRAAEARQRALDEGMVVEREDTDVEEEESHDGPIERRNRMRQAAEARIRGASSTPNVPGAFLPADELD